jgi:hypothetical protein
MWEEILLVIAAVIIILALFGFGLKLKAHDNMQLEKYFKKKH